MNNLFLSCQNILNSVHCLSRLLDSQKPKQYLHQLTVLVLAVRLPMIVKYQNQKFMLEQFVHAPAIQEDKNLNFFVGRDFDDYETLVEYA